jgi:hypothetical protein
MRSPIRYAANRAGRELARSYVRQHRRNIYVNKQQSNNTEISTGDALFAWCFVIGCVLFFFWIMSL